MVTNLQKCYLILKMSYVKLLLIIKQIFISIKLKFPRETSCIYDSLAKSERKIKYN